MTSHTVQQHTNSEVSKSDNRTMRKYNVPGILTWEKICIQRMAQLKCEVEILLVFATITFGASASAQAQQYYASTSASAVYGNGNNMHNQQHQFPQYYNHHYSNPYLNSHHYNYNTPPPETRPGGSLSLHDILPADHKSYDKNKPPKNNEQPTIVYFHVTVLSIDSINEESMTYVADIFLAQSWRDHRLRLGTGKMDDHYRILDVQWLNVCHLLSRITNTIEDIWRPDCFFKNAKSVTFHEMSVPNHYLWLYNDKTLLYISKLTLVLSCGMHFEKFPHDSQECLMQIESLSHTTEDLVFRWNKTDPLVVNTDIELPQLDIARNDTTDCTLEYSTGNFTCLAVVFELKRRLGYHLFHTYIPSALIVVMSWISFWIKPEAIPARVTLGVTSLLTLATQNTQSQSSLPPVSYVKAIDVWMSSCTVFVFMSLMEFALVNHFLGSGHPIDRGYDDIHDFNSIIDSQSKPLKTTPCNYCQIHGRLSATTANFTKFCSNREIALAIDRISRFFFPFSFGILNIVYWCTFLG